MKNRNLYIFALLPFVIGVIFGSIFDYQIDVALYLDPHVNVFGLIFSAFMPMISYSFFALLSGMSLHFFFEEKKTLKKIILIAITIVFYGVATYFAQDKILSTNAFGIFDGLEKYSWACWLGTGIVEAIFVFLGFRCGKKNNDIKLLYAGLVFSVAILFSLVPFSQLLKILMRRPRFRSIGVIEGAVFKNWWESFKSEYDVIKANHIESISEEFKSFPSGHTGEAAILMFYLPYLTKLDKNIKKMEILMFIFGISFTLLMGFSRMTMGAHYLSDVCMGALFTSIFSVIANEINLKYFYPKEDKEIQTEN